MFEDMLIDEKIKTHRGKATILSFILQICLVMFLVIIPLLITQALPTRLLTSSLVAPPPPPPPPPPAGAPSAARRVEQTQVRSEMEVPLKIPQRVTTIKDLPQSDQIADAAPAAGGVVGGVPGGVEGGTVGGVMGGVLGGVGAAVPKLAAPNRVKVSSGVTQGLLIHQVKPEYPAVARSSGTQGTVVLQAVIGKDGRVKEVRIVSGLPMFTQPAVAAVKQWQYKPYVLNGQPVEIESTVTVNFKLAS
ncbi:MAG: energy transducer TonB [Terriglobales bacterium]